MNDGEVELLKSPNANLEDIYVDEYQSIYRQHIHTLLAWGYADSRNKVQAKHENPDITGFIAEAVQNRLDAFDSPSGAIRSQLKMTIQFPVQGEQGVADGGRI